MALWDLADVGSRIVSLLAAPWWGSDSLVFGGNTYGLAEVLGTPFVAVKKLINKVGGDFRLQSAQGSAVDAIADDLFGVGAFPRGYTYVNGAFQLIDDATYATLIRNNLTLPINTIAGITARVQVYLQYYYQEQAAQDRQLLGLDTSGGLDSWGALDGGASQLPPLPSVEVFDLASDPVKSASIGLTDSQFCVYFKYGSPKSEPMYAGSSYVGRSNYSVGAKIRVIPALTAELGALVNSIRAQGMQPVYADDMG